MAMSAVLLSRTRTPCPHLQLPANPKPILHSVSFDIPITRRLAILTTFTLSTTPFIHTSSASAESFLSGISNTKSWFQFYGDGFSIRVPPQFQDIMEPEDYNVGLSLYGDKAKPKTFAARFASPDGMPKLICIDPQVPIFKKAGEVVLKIMGRTQIKAFPLVGAPFPSYWSDLRKTINEIGGAFSYYSSRYDDGIETRSEVLSVVIRPSNQLKITFLEAKDIADLGSLKEAAKIFVPGGATLYSARTIKIKEEEGYRNYYFYEFGNDIQHAALVVAVNSGKAFIAGATAPHNKWNDDGMRLRSAAVSLTVL